MKRNAYAKINLALNVVGRKSNGYHELDMIMAPISLHDVIHLEISNQDEFSCSDTSLSMGEHNTIYKVVQLVRNTFNINTCFKIHVEKNIPMQAGLAGGSADAACVLHMLNEILDLKLSEEELIQLGVQVGADVPFCLVNELARVKGIGEKIERLTLNETYYAVIMKGKKGVSTKECFEHINFQTCIHPPIDEIEDAISKNKPFSNLLANTMEESACSLNSEILEVKNMLNKFDFEMVLMSGSGASVFGLTKSETYANEVVNQYKGGNYFVEAVKILQN